MKKYIAIALMAVSCFANAKGNPSESSSPSGSVISYAATPRSLTFTYIRNETDANGRILVCLLPFKADWNRPGECVDAYGRNAWSLAENALPGFNLVSYEYRIWGSQ